MCLAHCRDLFALILIKVVGATAPNRVSTANLPKRINQHSMLAFPKDHATGDTSLQGIEGNTVKTHKAIGTSIIADRAMRPKLWTGLAFLALGGFDRLNGLCTSTYCQLSTQPETATGF